MFKSPVRRSWVNQTGQSKLMDVSKPLKWLRVNHPPFLCVNADERMDRVADLVLMFGHWSSRASRPSNSYTSNFFRRHPSLAGSTLSTDILQLSFADSIEIA